MKLTNVLILTPDSGACAELAKALRELGLRATLQADLATVLHSLATQRVQAVLADVRHSDVQTLRALREAAGGARVIALVDGGDVERAALAGRDGADSCLALPCSAHALERVLRAPRLDALPASSPGMRQPCGAAPAMRDALQLVERAAKTDVPVLLRGESGSGKGMIAELLHARGARHAARLVVVSCPTLPESLLSSELFGHVRGAFTNALADRIGRVEAAHGGTLFLDEIGEVPPSVQAQLLRFLQDQSFERLGENRTRHADVRIIAATHRDLESDVESGRFRADLYYRLSVLEIQVPPLRDRREDVLPLARRFLAESAGALGRPAPALTSEAECALLAYSWPGNVRELKNEMARTVVLQDGPRVEVTALSRRLRASDRGAPVLGGDFTLEAIEREHVERIVGRCKTLEQASLLLGIDDTTLWRKRKRYASQPLPRVPRHVARN